MPTTVAFHGWVPWPLQGHQMLRRDINYNFTPTTYYPKGHDLETIADIIEHINDNLFLIGYSKGGDLIAQLTHTPILPRIKAAVLYEAPLFDDRIPLGDFPVISIWNDRGYRLYRRGEQEAHDTYWKWSENHPVHGLWGQGKHFTLFPPAHGWDQSLNPKIMEILDVVISP